MDKQNTAVGAPQGMAGQMASYIGRARTLATPAASREAALQCFFDLLTAVAVGLEDLGPAAIRKTASSLFGGGEVPLWFAGETSSVLGAAWANSSAAAALDLDDGNRYARGHPGAAIIPAAVAVAAEVNATFDALLNAIVIGYEVGVAVGTARTTYGSSGTWTPYGVVAAVAALRGTPVDIIAHALAIAGESAPNQSFAGGPAPRIPAPEGAAVKEGIPWSVVTGITAVHLAQAGHTGPRNILDSVRHYVFPDQLDLDLGRRICATYFKPYACCRHIHAPLAALQALMDEHGIEGRMIDTIDVRIHAAGLRISNRPSPGNLIDVQYSIPYCLALMALRGPESLIPVTSASLGLTDVTALAQRVGLALSPEFDAVYPEEIVASVTITTTDGVQFVSPATPPKGEPLMTWAELSEKFLTATRGVVRPAVQRQLLDAVEAARAGDGAALMACLSGVVLRA